MTEWLFAPDPASWLIENGWLVPIGFAHLIAGLAAMVFRHWALGFALTAWAAILLGSVQDDVKTEALKERLDRIEIQLEARP